MICTPTQAEFTLAEYNVFDYMPNWVQPLVGSPEERAAKLRIADRSAMKRDVEELPLVRTDWGQTNVLQVAHERNHKYEGRTIEEIAGTEGKHPVDVFLDLALDEELQTVFGHEFAGQGDEGRDERLKNPYGHISVPDGGAHTRFFTQSTWPVYWLYHWIRDREVMSLEQAHYKMSSLPAWIAGFKDRGTLASRKLGRHHRLQYG